MSAGVARLRALRAGDLTATEAIRERLARLHDLDAATHAIADFNDERALAEAAALDRRYASEGPAGPLHGMPVTVKDWIDVEGFTCGGATAAHRDRRPAHDATAVARLRAAGAVVVAKTRAWANGSPSGRGAHPLAQDRTPGGSSTGEAAAIGAGASYLGLGSDSGGSIRLPAAWCGAFGFKPSAGRVPTTGHFPRVGALSDGRTQLGPLADSVELLELALGVIAGPDWRDAGVAPVPLGASREVVLAGAAFAVVTEEGEWWAAAGTAEAVEAAAARLASAGLRRAAWDGPWLAEGLRITEGYWRRSARTGAEAEQQLWDWDRYRRAYLERAATIDFLLTPAVREVAPLDREVTGPDFIFTLPASLTGSPAIVVPAGRDAVGLPLAVQLIGRPWEDDRVFAAAKLLHGDGRAWGGAGAQ
jgi:amidase